MRVFTVQTSKKRQVIDITAAVEEAIGDEKKSDIVHVFVRHTTAALSIADLDPGGTDEDYLDAFDRMVPKLTYRHPHDPSHMPDHILSTLVGCSVSAPVEKGSLVLGTWQRIALFEFDGPRERTIVVSF